MTPAELVLSCLTKVRPAGHDKWTAACPAHKDKRPSLAIAQTADGAVLINCFAGCSAADIVGALGLSLSDLFPADDPTPYASGPRVSALTPLIVNFEHDLIIVHLLLADIGNGKPISAADRATAKAAAARIWAKLQEARHVI